MFRDISERKSAEDKLCEAFEQIADLKDALERERDYLREEVRISQNFGDIVGQSGALQNVLGQTEAVAGTQANVLVLGESGTGKELVARAIHENSTRCDGALIKVNCPSIPKELFESEFFGHVKGAFTGAHRDRVGRFQLADGGTLFLDEVGEIPLDLQGKLLRALQEREFERVGEDQTRHVDVRVVAATNRDLRKEAQAGRFRQDLYYRLSVFPIEVPPLRERREDIVPLAIHFTERVSRELGIEPPNLTRTHADQLLDYAWPGNIRELQNVIERALILSMNGPFCFDLEPSDGAHPRAASMPLKTVDHADSYLTNAEFRERERRNLVAALEHAGGRVSGPGGAAELLGLKPTTLAHRMKTFGISRR